jgi:hypothetical protein
MGCLPPKDQPELRLLSSPGLTPTIVPSPKSPAKSVHVQKMAADPKIPGDFFDDGSSVDEETVANWNEQMSGAISTTNITLPDEMNKDDSGCVRKQAPARPARPPQSSFIPDIFRPFESHGPFGEFADTSPRNNSYPGANTNRLSSSVTSVSKYDAMINAQAMTLEAILRVGPDGTQNQTPGPHDPVFGSTLTKNLGRR